MRPVGQLKDGISFSQRALIGYMYVGFGLASYLLFQRLRDESLMMAAGLVFVGIASIFLAYRYLSLEYDTLLRYKELLYFFIAPVLVFYFLITIGFDKYLLQTSFGRAWLGNVMFFSRSVLNLIGLPYSGVGNEIILSCPDYPRPVTLLVTEECSGIHSSFLFLAFFGMMLVDLRSKLSWKMGAVYFAVGAIGTYSANIVRIVVLSLITYYIGFNAMRRFHDYFGFVFFIGWIFIFWFFVYRRVQARGISEAKPTPGG